MAHVAVLVMRLVGMLWERVCPNSFLVSLHRSVIAFNVELKLRDESFIHTEVLALLWCGADLAPM